METYVTEITSFVLDRLLGFFHTPPVVPRFFTATELNMLATLAEVRPLPPAGAPSLAHN